MGRWGSPSDLDYWDEFNRFPGSGIERTCQECGEPVMVPRGEAYQIHVFHQPCLDRIAARMKRRTLKAEIEGKKTGAA